MSTIIDRRLNGKNKSSPNRRKFFRRAKEAIREAVDKRIADGKIKDTVKDTNVRVKKKTIDEPSFKNSRSGRKQGVHPGNKEYHRGDELDRPRENSGGRGKGGGEGDISEDEFIFTINRSEFLEIFFENLELPDLIKTSLINIEEWKWRRAGYATDGAPANLNIIRSLEASLMRRSALEGAIEEEIKEVKERISKVQKVLKNKECEDHMVDYYTEVLILLAKELKELEEQEVPYIDDVDIRYNIHVKEPDPSNNAVMFCVMDVSISMGEFEKMLSKKFFLLLYLFLEREYESIDLVFIRYYHNAEEVNEDDFWHKVTSGGTITSKGLDLALEIIQDRYPTADWNIYLAHTSDGDNFSNDRVDLRRALDRILPYLQYYAYIQVGENIRALWNMGEVETELWSVIEEYAKEYPKVAMALIEEEKQIWPVFRSLFEKREESAS